MNEEIKKVIKQMIQDGEIYLETTRENVGDWYSDYKTSLVLCVSIDGEDVVKQDVRTGVDCKDILKGASD